jgi:hypothetical protein
MMAAGLTAQDTNYDVIDAWADQIAAAAAPGDQLPAADQFGVVVTLEPLP